MRLKHFLSVFLTLLTLSIGQMWADESWDLTTNSHSSASTATVTWIGTNATMTLEKNGGTNANNYLGGVNSRNHTRVYNNNILRITPTEGQTISSIEITSTSSTNTISGTWTNGSASTSGSKTTVTPTDGTNAVYCTCNATKQITSVVVKFGSSCNKKVTITKSSATNGSYTLKAGSTSGATIDNNGTVDNCDANATIVLIPSANTHYHVDEVTASNSANVTGPDAIGNYTITYTKGSNISTTIGVTFEADPTYTVTWVAGSNSSFHTQTNYAGTALTDPGTPDADLYCPGGKVFKGWTSSPIEGEGSAPADLFTSVSGKSIPVDGTTYYAVFATEQTGSKTTKTDNLTHTINGKSNTNTTYTAFTNKSYTSDAKYAGQSNNGNNNTIKGVIQLRCSIPAGIVSTTSGGKIKKVTVTWNSNTSAGRYVTIYGKNSAYTGSSDLYAENTRGTELGTIIKGTSTELTVDGSYEYIGILASNALYMTQVDIQWEVSTTTYSNYATTCCSPLGSINGSINLAQKSATLSWDLEDAQNGGKDHINSWKVEYKLSSANAWTVAESELAKATLTKTISDLNCNTDYDFRVSANVQSGYCDIEKEWTSQKTTKFTITKDETGGGGITLSPAATSVCDGDVIDVTANTPDGSHEGTGTIKVIKTGSNPENDVTSTVYNSGTGKLTMPAYDITIKATYAEKSSPSVGVSVDALNFGSPKKGASVNAQTFNLTGSALTVGTLTLVAPSGYTVSPSSITVASAGALAAQTITITPNTSTAGTFNGSISVSGAGVSSTNIVSLSMTVQETYTVNWYVNGTKIDANSKTDVTGTAVTAPSDFSSFTDCVSDFHFIGWAESAIAGGSSTSKPTLVTPITTIGTANKDYYAVFADGTPGSTNKLLEETFDNERTSDNNTAITEVSDNFTGSGKVYEGAYGTLKFGSSSERGHITSKTLDLSEAFTVQVSAKQYGTDASVIYVQVGEDKREVSTTDSLTNEFKTFTFVFEGTEETTITIGESGKRGYIDDVVVSQESDPVWTKYYSTCPHITSVTLSAGSANHGSISFEKGGSTVTSVRTDGESPVEVDVVATIDDGYELTGLTLTSEDVTGATKNDALTKITIPAGEDGTLIVTATFTQIPKYSITFNGGGATGEGPASIEDQYAGTEITLPENNYTYTDHKFKAWEVTNNSTSAKIDIADGKFTMPAANVTIMATWNKIEKCAMSFMVAGNEVANANVQQEEAYSLAGVSHPNVPGFTWEGWSETEYNDEVTILPTTIPSYTPEAGEGTKTLYGVYKRVDTSGANYGKYVRATEVAEGDYLIVCESQNVAFDGSLTTTSTLEATGNYKSVTITEGVLTLANADNYVFSLAEVTGGYSIKSKSGYYIGCTGSGNGFNSSTTQAYTNTVSLNNNNFTITSSGGAKLQYYKISGQERFRYYTSNQQAIALYKKDNGTTYYTSSPVEKVTISFNANGGEGGCSQRVINKGSQLTICSDVPTNSHSDFTGWNSNQDGSGNAYTAGQTYTFNETVTLYAQWKDATPHAVTYAANGATGSVPTEEDKYAGDQFNVKAGSLTKTNYTFQGWKHGGKLYKAGDSFTMPNEAVEFVAQWKKSSIQTDKMPMITDVAGLSDGMQVALGCSYGESNFAMAGDITGSNKFMNSVSGDNITLSNGVATYTEDVIILTLEKAVDGWKITKDGTNYLNETSVKNIAWATTKENATTWTISFEGNNVKIASEHGYIQYNATYPRFTTYESGQKDIQLFGKAMVIDETAKISDLGFVEGETVVASGTGVVLTIDEPTPTTSITASNGATVVVNTADAQAENITVEDGGTVEVAQDVTVETLVISTSLGSISGEEGNTGGKSGQVTGSGSINATGDVFIQIELTQDEKASAGWYAFSLPFKVDALNGVYFGDKKLQNEKDYAIMAWHGEIRATGEYGWKKYREVMDPGVLYIITVGNTDYKTLRFKKVAGEAIVQAEDDLTISAFVASGEGQQATDAGWNGIGNKSLQIMQQGSYSTMQFLDHTDNAFKARNNGDVNILVGSAFFVQYGSGVGTTVSMEASTSGSIALAPAREQESIEKTVFEAKLKNAETGKTEDNLFFTAREDALNEYEAGRDVTKMSMGEAKCAQMFIPAYGTKLCAADFPLVNNQAAYPLTMTIPTTGTYYISIKENENANIYLTKNGAIIWNLTKSPYTIEMEEGTTEGYGLILVKRMPQDVETVSGDASEAGVQKVVINDKVFILRGEQLFGIDGKLVK